MAGADEGYHFPAGLLGHHLAHAKMGGVFQSLGNTNDHRIVVNIRRNTAANGTGRERRTCHNHQLAATNAVVFAADGKILRQYCIG